MTTPQLHPYLFFQGDCAEAFEFYRSVLGGELQVMKYKDAPENPEGADCGPGPMKPNYGDKVMHACLRSGEHFMLMGSDDCMGDDRLAGVSLSLGFGSEDEVRRVFDALSRGGKVDMPPGPTFWSPLFAMCTDRFGVSWMLGLAECALEK